MMTLALLGILAAFAWLMAETDWLRIRLLVGLGAPVVSPELYNRLVALLIPPTSETPATIEPLAVAAPIETPAPKLSVNTGSLLLAAQCQLTELQERFGDNAYGRDWHHDRGYGPHRRASYQEMHIGKVTIHLSATDTHLHKLIAEVTQAQFGKLRAAPCTAAKLPLIFVEDVRIGSHREWQATDTKGHGYHHIVEDSVTRFKDCLPGVAWLEAHYKDHADFQPAMDISVDGETKFAMTESTYKATAVKDFMKQYKRRGKAPVETERELVAAEIE